MNESQRELTELLRAIASLRADGNPLVYDPLQDEALARTALRRWASYPRRAAPGARAREARVEDLAKGLRDATIPNRQLVGPTMDDFRELGEVLAVVLAGRSNE